MTNLLTEDSWESGKQTETVQSSCWTHGEVEIRGWGGWTVFLTLRWRGRFKGHQGNPGLSKSAKITKVTLPETTHYYQEVIQQVYHDVTVNTENHELPLKKNQKVTPDYQEVHQKIIKNTKIQLTLLKYHKVTSKDLRRSLSTLKDHYDVL